ncbi:MAG: EF-hand domain-containing protein [Thiocapsa sp.]|jgi:hypothetical protein|nr:EF-hand domain-containing protein [Thiocapsa sp.]MCG6898348.1 EF-hand domain-containing protein [Thiocapsa sp.]MCG6983802.1 EF-hand domain-containing protein [Thiocapsa sp.]
MKTKIQRSAIGLTLTMVCAVSPALAQPVGPPGFSTFDLNGDGILTEQEFGEARANRIKERSQQGYPMRNLATAPPFTAFDLNSDGGVTPEEFAAGQAQHRQQRMQTR